MALDKTMKTVVYGNGAMAKVLYSYARHSMNICGFTVDDSCIPANSDSFCNLPLVPLSKIQETFDPEECQMIIAVGFLDMNELREKKYLELKSKGYVFSTYIHESVLIHDDVTIAENCIILDHVSIHPGCRIGQGTFITSNVNVGHDCFVGPYNWINAGVSIAGGCHIGQGCFWGVNSSTAENIDIGKHNFIAANTLINKNTKDNEVYLSEPGQLFRLSSKSFLNFIKKKNRDVS
jgi:sugar O-acyltransferase (sialic acid O-acetyltransferase NeuD family)